MKADPKNKPAMKSPTQAKAKDLPAKANAKTAIKGGIGVWVPNHNETLFQS